MIPGIIGDQNPETSNEIKNRKELYVSVMEKYISEESKSAKHIYIPVPGLTKENIRISFENGYLKIGVSSDNVYLNDCEFVKITIDFTEDKSLDFFGTKASVNNGMLEVVVPKTQYAQEIELEVS